MAEIIREFLSLPPGAMPSVTWVDDSVGEDRAAWDELRAVAAGEPPLGDVLILRADRDGWRDGVRVRV